MPLTFSLLALTVLSLWCTGEEDQPGWRRQVWLLFLAAALMAGLISGVLTLTGLAWVLIFALACFYLGRTHVAGLRVVAAIGVLAMSAGFMLHRLPGFVNPRVIEAVRFTPDALPFTLYLNLDKTLIGIFLLGWCHTRMTRAWEWRAMAKRAALPALLVIAVMLVLSLISGYVQWAPKFPADTWLWLGANLLFVCLAEEAFFRGFIQKELGDLWSSWQGGRVLALGMAGGLFGLAHFAGGPAYVALATVAGLGYGWIYHRTGRIEASLLTHFALNAVHFFFFTYPALQPVVK